MEKKACYAALKELSRKKIAVSKLLDEGMCNHGKNTFRLFSWIDGVAAEELLSDFPKKKQYELGVQAGIILKEIYQKNCPKNQKTWSEHYKRKIDKKIEQYKKCGVTLKNADKILTYIERHRHLIEQRPQCFHHGDYHIGNMLITPENTQPFSL